MVFVYTFAVGGGSGKVVPFPNWALVSSIVVYSILTDIGPKNPKGNPDYCKRLT